MVVFVFACVARRSREMNERNRPREDLGSERNGGEFQDVLELSPIPLAANFPWSAHENAWPRRLCLFVYL